MAAQSSLATDRQLIRTSRGYVHVRSAGRGGRPIVLLPILPIGTLVFEHCLPSLADLGYAPVVIDLMGYGASDKRTCHWSIVEFADNVEEVLGALAVAPTRVVGGHFTSLVATELAARPEAGVEALVLDGPTLSPGQYGAQAGQRQLAPPSTNDREFGAGQWDHIANMFRKLDPTFAVDETNEMAFRKAFLAMGEADMPPSIVPAFRDFDMSARLAQVKARLLVVGATHDTQVQFYEPALRLMPEARGHFFEGVHPLHDLSHPARATEYVALLDRFFGGG